MALAASSSGPTTRQRDEVRGAAAPGAPGDGGIPFVKMHGIGNDYVYVIDLDGALAPRIGDPAQLAVEISDRHRAVGSDGLILLLRPEPGVDADVRMRMFNADGSEGEMCGNGIRCVAKLAVDRGISAARPLRVQTARGVLAIDWRLGPDGRVAEASVEMGAPILDLPSIPADAARLRVVEPGASLVEVDLDGRSVPLHLVSMGNPHAVWFLDDLDAEPLAVVGPRLERHPAFPKRMNVHLVRVDGPRECTMRTWERGSGPTLACGTGASAVCVAGVLSGRMERSVLAHLPGGDLRLEWRPDGQVIKTGPAVESFVGIWRGAAACPSPIPR